jgi:WD repeat and SOF domain-containing protein 1
MKIKALSRSVESSTRSSIGDQKVISRNLDPKHKPHEKAREYTRAINAAKLSRMFAKPFVASLEGHIDAIACSTASRGHLCPFVTGGVDGEVRVWDLATQKTVWSSKTAHAGWVKGVVVSHDGQSFYSAGSDKTVKQWSLGVSNVGGRKEKKSKKKRRGDGADNGNDDEDNDDDMSSDESSSSEEEEEEAIPEYTTAATTTTTSLQFGLSNTAAAPKPINSWMFPHTFKSIDHHWKEPQFATACDESVEVWNPERSNPIMSFKLWGDDSVNVVRYNPSETCLLAHCSSDRGIGLHDVRANTGLRKTVLSMRSNCLEWNPLEPFNFVVGNEDHNCYSFDMRRLDQPLMIHKGHVAAVLSIGWSSTGREFATGSYDRSVRIFNSRGGTSRDCYTSKRMQRVFTVNYTGDAKFIISGSDDTNVRIWKARSNDKLGQTLVREEKAMNYNNALIKKYQYMPEVRNITKQRAVPKFIKKQTVMKHVQKESGKKKQENIIKHSKAGSVERVGERGKVVVKQQD